MKISIWSAGDPSVGINGGNAEVDIVDGAWIDENGIREEVRASLHRAFTEIFDDGHVSVVFEDEINSG